MSKGKNFSLTCNNPLHSFTEWFDMLKTNALYARA